MPALFHELFHPGFLAFHDLSRLLVADQDRMDTFRADILKTLQKLSKRFLIVDLAPSEYHLNYGIERDGSWCFIDGCIQISSGCRSTNA